MSVLKQRDGPARTEPKPPGDGSAEEAREREYCGNVVGTLGERFRNKSRKRIKQRIRFAFFFFLKRPYGAMRSA